MPNTNLLSIVVNILSSIFISIYIIYSWYDCLGERHVNKTRTILLILFLGFVITIWNFMEPKPIRIIGAFIFQMMICNFLVTKNIKSAISLVLISQIIIWISEFSFIFVLSIVNIDSIDLLTHNPKLFFILNLYITVISYIIQRTKIPTKIYKKFKFEQNNHKSSETIFFSSIIILIIVISTTESYMKLPTTIILVTNILMAIIFITIVIASSKTKANYNKINSKYETSISSLKEYEVMINQFGMYTHENKNEIYTVRNMLKNGAKREEVIKYIDALIDNKIKDNAKIMRKTNKIPSGGLRATIYSKLCLMDELGIKHVLNISRDVKTTDLIALDEDLILKICKILGVFLDNAIDAVKELKQKQVTVDIYVMDQNLCIDITNKFKGMLDLDKISEAKYTTKGDGHGYGLTLVQQLLEEEKGKLENEKRISRDTFTQTLKIKM